MPKEKVQIQDTITISAHQRKTVHNIFSTTVEFLEKYIEIAGYYDDWEQRKQIHNNEVVRKDIIGDPEKAEKSFSVTLFGFRQALENKPEFFRDELKEEFYRWISATGIDAKNAHPRLKNNLFGFHEILEGRGEKIMEDVLNRKDRLDVNSPDYAEKLNSFYSALQVPLEKGREQEKLLKNKTYKDIEIEKRFGVGDDEQGKHVFGQISESIEDYQNFHHFKQQGQQQSASSSVPPGSPPPPPSDDLDKVLWDVKTNPQNWRLDEVITELGNLDEVKQEFVLIHKDAQEDYNHEGKLNFNNNPIYRWSNFNARERFEIKQAKNLLGEQGGYSTNDEVNWIVEEVKSNPFIWKIEEIQGQTWLIHNSAQKDKNEIGTLIHNKRKFNDLGWAEINRAFERARLVVEFKQNAKLEKRLFVINLETGERSEGEDWIIHNRLERKIVDNYLVFVPNAMIRVKDLTEAEKVELGMAKQESQVQTQTTSHHGGRGGGSGWGDGYGNIYVAGSISILSLIGLAFVK